MIRPAEEETKIIQETKLNFDGISETDKAIFMSELSSDKKKLSLKGFEAGDSPEIEAIDIFLRNNPHVTGFRWGGADVNDSEFATLVRIPLKSLELPDCTQVTDDGMRALCGNTTFESLTLLRCNQTTDAGLRSLATMQGLKSLVLDTGANVIDLGILGDMPELRSLTLYCSGIQVASLPKLESLTLMGVALTDADLAALQNDNPNLNLAFNACTGITEAAKGAVKEADKKALLEDKVARETNAGLFAFLQCVKGAEKKTLAELANDKVEPKNPHFEALRGELYGDGKDVLKLIVEEISVPRPRPRPIISFKTTFH